MAYKKTWLVLAAIFCCWLCAGQGARAEVGVSLHFGDPYYYDPYYYDGPYYHYHPYRYYHYYPYHSRYVYRRHHHNHWRERR